MFINCSQSGFTCMSFYRRDIHVMEVQTGINTKRQEDACTSAYFNRTNLPYVTLVSEYYPFVHVSKRIHYQIQHGLLLINNVENAYYFFLVR